MIKSISIVLPLFNEASRLIKLSGSKIFKKIKLNQKNLYL